MGEEGGSGGGDEHTMPFFVFHTMLHPCTILRTIGNGFGANRPMTVVQVVVEVFF